MSDSATTGLRDLAGTAVLEVPGDLPLLPLFDTVIFPAAVVPLAVAQPAAVRLIDAAVGSGQLVCLVALRGKRPASGSADYYAVGTAAIVHRLLRLPDNTLRVAVEGLARVAIDELIAAEPYARARVRLLPDAPLPAEGLADLGALVAAQVGELASLLPRLDPAVCQLIGDEADAGRRSFLVASAILPHLPLAERQELLELPDAHARLEALTALLAQEIATLKAGRTTPHQAANKQQQAPPLLLQPIAPNDPRLELWQAAARAEARAGSLLPTMAEQQTTAPVPAPQLIVAAGLQVGAIWCEQQNQHHGTFGYWLFVAPEQRRRGYATSALRKLLHHCFEELGYQKASIAVLATNDAALALHQKLGFVHEGRLRRMQRSSSGYVDVICLGMTDEEWHARREAEAK